MKLGSLFDGIGGFCYAAQRHGITPVWASEIEPSCVSITRRHFPYMKHLGDITQINGAEIEPVDIITFGSPCQDLSVAGKRAGLAGARSGLFDEAIRIIDEMRSKTNDRYPTWSVWENVPGALSGNNGLDFKAVLEAFTKTAIPMPDSGRWASAGMVRGGRCDIAWRILDAQYWGVAQRRRRIFLVADFGGRRAAEVLFKSEGLRGDPAPGGETRQETAGAPRSGAENTNIVWPDVARTLAARHDSSPCVDRGANVVVEVYENHAQDSRISGPLEVSPTVSRKWGTGGNNTPLVAGFMSGQGAKAGGIGWQEETAPTLKASASGTNQIPAVMCIQNTVIGRTGNNGPDGKGVKSDVSYTLDTKEPHAVVYNARHDCLSDVSYTILAKQSGGVGLQDINPVCVAHGQAGAEICENLSPTLNCNHEQPYIAGDGYIVRRLTPLETERLQGFPDNWTAYGADGEAISDSRRYAAIGNSVAIPCVDYVLAGILDVGINRGCV